jgi:5'-nucleotidase / UDP-sugar diphosphatase
VKVGTHRPLFWRHAAALALLLVGVATAIGLPKAQAPTTAAVTFLHLNDVYEIGAVEGGRSGGLARVASIIDSARNTSGARVITTLGGDYLSPSALGTARLDGEPLAGRQMVDVLNMLGLEWATFGNHEFDITESQLRARLAESAFRLVTTNVTDARGELFPNTRRTAVIEVTSGARRVRIGLIGLTLDANRKPWVVYKPVVNAARSGVDELVGRVDAIVALTHLTLAGDAELVAAVPEIDLVLGGHEHENWLIRRGSRFTPIVKADANARSIAFVTMTFGLPGARPTVEAKFTTIDAAVPSSPAVEVRVASWIARAFEAFRKDGFAPETTVAITREALDGRESTVRNRPTKLTEIIANAIAREAGSSIGVFNTGSVRIDDELPAGPITEYDIIRVLPFGGPVLKAALTGALLARVLDIGLGNQGTGAYLQTSTGVVRTSAGWTINGVPLDPARAYELGIADFLLTGAAANLEFLTRTHPAVSNIQELRDVRRAVIDELKRTYP